MSRRLGEVEQLLAETPTNCDHILLHVAKKIVAKADRVRDGTGESDEQSTRCTTSIQHSN